jgi:XRE family aerobic/anaerobic benzoate catabolism transcriptional regulator
MQPRHTASPEALELALTAERDFLAALGARVRAFREQARLTRKRLAVVAEVSERYLGQLEAGEGNISIVLLRRVAEALGTHIGELLHTEQEALADRLVRRFLHQMPAHQLEEVLVRLAREVGAGSEARRDRIALIGTRGAGKSTLGERYAAELGIPFVELDREIERAAGMPLADLFLLNGQAGYRRLERTCLEQLIAAPGKSVIAVGGGIVSEPESYDLLLSRCYTVWVKASPEEHMTRVIAQGDLRPMARSAEAMEELKRLLKSREPACQKADTSIDTTGLSIDAALARLRRNLEKI